MLALILFLASTGFCGWRLTGWLARREPARLTRLEQAVWLGTLWMAVWLVEGYALALAGRFSAGALLSLSVLVSVVLIAAGRQRFVAPRRPNLRGRDLHGRLAGLLRHRFAPATVLPLLLVALWLAYTVAALWLLPVSNHDALSYHFPKAAWLTTTGGFGLYPSQDLRVTYFPGNYEMLVATFLTFLRSDRATGLITSGSLGLFLAASLVFFRRAWGNSPAAMLALPVMLASPVLLLHTTAHKNDILMAAVTLNALIWLGRYAVHGGLGSAVVGGVSLGLAVGTKFHGLFLGLACTALLWRAWRTGIWRPSLSGAMLQAVCAAILFLLLGGVQYVANAISTGHVTGILQIATPNAMNTVAYPAFWQVPRFTLMLLGAPFLTDGAYFRIPWSDEAWYWPAYELYFSHYGAHVSLLVLLLPVGVWWGRRRLEPTGRAEVAAITIAGLVVVALNALMGLRPYGGFAFIPRFLFFALPLLLVWTWCPGVRYLTRVRRLAWVPLAASLLLPVTYMVLTVHKDQFSPLAYVHFLWKAPQERLQIVHYYRRAASFVDRFAAAEATVAIESGYDGWTYPLWGTDLTRTVQVILESEADYVPGPEVEWVAVDRWFSKTWGHPDFTDMSLASRYIGGGVVPDGQKRVFNTLMSNADFELVYFSPAMFQAVFRRIHPVPAKMNLHRRGPVTEW